jgi:hypothetical protein
MSKETRRLDPRERNAHVIAYVQNKYARGTGYKPLRREFREAGQ